MLRRDTQLQGTKGISPAPLTAARAPKPPCNGFPRLSRRNASPSCCSTSLQPGSPKTPRCSPIPQYVSEQPALTLWHVLLFPAVLLLQSKTGEPVAFPGHLGGTAAPKTRPLQGSMEETDLCEGRTAEIPQGMDMKSTMMERKDIFSNTPA